MIVLDSFEQRSPEWVQARLGVITASEFHRILTPARLEKSSTQARRSYRYRLLAEWLTGQPSDSYTNKIIERGMQLEAEARDYYQFTTDREVKQVGFIYKDENRLVGCSPDGILGDFESGLEIKCPDAHTHVGYLLDGKLPTEYILQVQGAMWITGARTWDWLSYHPDMQSLLITVERDPRVIDALQLAVDGFITTMLRERQMLKPMPTKEALEASLELLGAKA